MEKSNFSLFQGGPKFKTRRLNFLLLAFLILILGIAYSQDWSDEEDDYYEIDPYYFDTGCNEPYGYRDDYGQCRSCTGTIYGCHKCQSASFGGLTYVQCLLCDEDFYLFQNKTEVVSSNYPTTFTFCVPDCPLAGYQYINDDISRECKFCGDHCKSCNINTGCEICSPAGQDLGWVNAITDFQGQNFSICQECNNSRGCYECHESDTSICINCITEYQDTSTPAYDQPFSCVTYPPNKEFDNCLQADPGSDTICTVCEDGFKISAFNFCTKCSQSNCLNCGYDKDWCDFCAEKYVLYNNECLNCNKYDDKTNYFPQCANCDSDFGLISPDDCLGCSNGFLDDNQNCVSKCVPGQYGYTEYMERGKVYASYCQDCHESCRECIGEGEFMCTKCHSGKYLSLSSVNVSFGQCVDKLIDTDSITLYVQAPSDDSFIPTGQDGSKGNPFSSIVDALTRSYEACANVKNLCAVLIYLLKGDHYVLRTYKQLYRPLNTDTQSQNIKMTIQPLFCSIDSSDASCVPDGDKIYLNNKLGTKFKLFVGAGLTIYNVIFDSLDSIVSQYDSSIADCLQKPEKCCEITPNTFEIVDYGTSSNYNCMISENQPSEVCNIADGGYFIKFDISVSTQLTEPATLLIENCEFRNYLFDFNSLIETNSYGGHIQIVDSVFDKFSSCGSIVRNHYYNYEPSVTNISNPQQNYQYRLSQLQLEIYDRIYSAEEAAIEDLTCDGDCFSLTVTNCMFINFGHWMYQEPNPVLVNPKYLMSHHGKVIQLRSFAGPITIRDSWFEGNILGFEAGCQAFLTDNQFKMVSSNDKYPIFSAKEGESRSRLQTKNLIAIMHNKYPVTIENNTFAGNSVVKGAIYIEGDPDQYEFDTPSIMIKDNVFKNNFAFFGSSAISIKRYYPDYSFYDPSVDTDLQPCGGIIVSGNTFEWNFGCTKYGGSVLSISCQDTVDEDPQDRSKEMTIPESVYAPESSLDPFDFSEYFDITLEDGIIDARKIELSGNTYTKNFVANNEGLIDLRGLLFVSMKNEQFQDNGENVFDLQLYFSEYTLSDMIPEDERQTIFLQNFFGEDPYLYLIGYAFQNFKGFYGLFTEGKGFQSLGCIHARTIVNLDLDSIVTDNQFAFQTIVNTTRGLIITLREFNGYLSISNSILQNQKGFYESYLVQYIKQETDEINEDRSEEEKIIFFDSEDMSQSDLFFEKLPLFGLDLNSRIFKLSFQNTTFDSLTFQDQESNEMGFILSHYGRDIKEFYVEELYLNNINCYCATTNSLFYLQVVQMKTWYVSVTNINQDIMFQEDVFSKYNYADHTLVDSSLYGQVFNIIFNNDEDLLTQYDFFQESYVDNLVGNEGALFKLSFLQTDVIAWIYKVEVSNVKTINGGLINVVQGNAASIWVQVCSFTDTHAYGLGGIFSVNPTWSTSDEDVENSIYELWVLNSEFSNNYLDVQVEENNYLLDHYYWAASGYIAFINQRDFVSLYIETSTVIQVDDNKVSEDYMDYNLTYVESLTSQISNVYENYSVDTYGTAFVVQTTQGMVAVNSWENTFKGC